MIVRDGVAADGSPVQFVCLAAGELTIRTADDEGRPDVDLLLDDPATLAELVLAASGSLEALSRSLLQRRRVSRAFAVPGNLPTLLATAREQLARAVTNLSQL